MRAGQVIPADTGFAGTGFARFVTEATPPRAARLQGRVPAPRPPGPVPPVDRGGRRHPQRPARPGVPRRTQPGRDHSRTGGRLPSVAAAIRPDRETDAPVERTLIAYDR
ncbi:hypothetical protein GCM10023224_45840 [Streptomonospora halophila]|uniref:Uncharacterized protein n=1 Tax=Streptomonospora halophila TaxID=427369 RepID=A0ABP9GWT6_9ACTN